MSDIKASITYDTIIPEGDPNITIQVWISYSIPNIKKSKIISRSAVDVETILIDKPSLRIIHNKNYKLQTIYKDVKSRMLWPMNDEIFYDFWKSYLSDKELKQIDGIPYKKSEVEDTDEET